MWHGSVSQTSSPGEGTDQANMVRVESIESLYPMWKALWFLGRKHSLEESYHSFIQVPRKKNNLGTVRNHWVDRAKYVVFNSVQLTSFSQHGFWGHDCDNDNGDYSAL